MSEDLPIQNESSPCRSLQLTSTRRAVAFRLIRVVSARTSVVEAKPCYITRRQRVGRGDEIVLDVCACPDPHRHRRADPLAKCWPTSNSMPHAPVPFRLGVRSTSESRVDDDNTSSPRSTFARWAIRPLRVQRAHRRRPRPTCSTARALRQPDGRAPVLLLRASRYASESPFARETARWRG